jgi:hypothetical protein
VTAAPLLPSEFLDRIVRPTVEESCRNPQDERLARQAVSELNNLAEKVFHYWGAGSRQVYGAANVSSYRTELAQRECSDFQLARDIADAHKHVELGRPGRQVTRDDQTTVDGLGYGEARYGVSFRCDEDGRMVITVVGHRSCSAAVPSSLALLCGRALHPDALVRAPDPDLGVVGLAHPLNADTGVLPTGRRVRFGR